MLLAVAGAGYVVDNVVAVVAPGSVPVLSSVTFLGGFLLAVWLVARARGATSTCGPQPLPDVPQASARPLS